jgi:hypothetical protein
MPVFFCDEFLRKESPLGKPVGDYNEHILRCTVMNQAIEGYYCTEPEIAAARRVIQASEMSFLQWCQREASRATVNW